MTVEWDSKDLMLCGLNRSCMKVYPNITTMISNLWYFGYFLRYWVCWVISISWCSFKRISIFCSGMERKAEGHSFLLNSFLQFWTAEKKILLGALRTRISCGRAISSKKKHGNHVSICNSSHSKDRMLLFNIVVHLTWPVEYLNILDNSTFDKIACFWLNEIMFNPKLHSPGVSLCGLGANPGVNAYVGWVCFWFSPLLRQVFLQVFRFSPLLKNQPF